MHAQSAIDQTINDSENVASILDRLRREPGLPGWVLMAPTRTLAALGISLDDEQLVQLLEQIEAMDNRTTPVTARELMTSNVITISADSSTHLAARVLSIACSVRYLRREPPHTLYGAIMTVGFQALRRILIAASVRSALRSAAFSSFFFCFSSLRARAVLSRSARSLP